MNIHDHLTGRKIVTKSATGPRRCAEDFPGWGAPDYVEHLLDWQEGLAGVITYVESHGSAPYTRFSIRFVDGSHASGVDPESVVIG